MSAPCANGLKYSGVAQVLSRATSAPRAWAATAIAGMSWTSNVSDPGDSVQTRRVRGPMSDEMPGPMSGS